jgi:hypothetical protein
MKYEFLRYFPTFAALNFGMLKAVIKAHIKKYKKRSKNVYQFLSKTKR